MTTRRALPFFGSRAGGKKSLSTRGALFAFGGGCDCADCGSLGLDRLSLGSHVGPPKRHTSASAAGPQCLDASDESPAASAAGPSGPPMELTVPTGAPTAKMANRRLCKELDEFEAIAARADSPVDASPPPRPQAPAADSPMSVLAAAAASAAASKSRPALSRLLARDSSS